MRLDVEITKDFEAIGSHKWASLLAKCPDATVFQAYEWLSNWNAVFVNPEKLSILVARNDEEIVGIAPLFEDTEAVDRLTLCFVGEGHSDFNLFLTESSYAHEICERLLDKALNVAAERGLRFRLSEVPRWSVLGRVLQARAKLGGRRPLQTAETPCPRLLVNGDSSAWNQAANKKSLKRHTTKLASRGDLHVDHLETVEAILPWLDSFFSQHIRRWAIASPPSLFHKATNRDFYRRLVIDLTRTGQLVFTVLRLGDAPIAFHFGLVSGNDFIWYKPSFDVRLRQFSPGEVLLRELFLLSDARGYNSFDFTRGDEAFKSRFASEVRVNDSYVVEPSARRTVAVVAKRVAIKCAKSALTAVGMSRMNCQSTRDATVADGVAGPTWRRLARAGKVAAVSVTGRIWTSPRKILIYSATPVACEDVRETRAADVVSMTFDELLDKLASDPSWHPFLSAAARRLHANDKCFVIPKDGEIAATGWVTETSPWPISELDTHLTFESGVSCIYDCWVPPKFRRQGLYRSLLLGIQMQIESTSILIYAVSTNRASLHGIERAGFCLDGHVQCCTMLGKKRYSTSLIHTAPAWSLSFAAQS